MQTNGQGTNSNIADDLRAFDKLPKAAREALAEGTENYNSAAVLRTGQRGLYDASEYVAEIGDIMREVTRLAAIRNYGRQHPQAQDDCRWAYVLRPRRVRTKVLDTRLTRLY